MTSLFSSRCAIRLALAATLSAPGLLHAQTAATTADTVAPSTGRESSYAITSGALALPGTLTLPANGTGRIAVVLIAAGSGPTDRNGNVQGANDIQVTQEDSRALAAAQPAAKLIVLPSANHVLKGASGADAMSQMPLYMDPRTPIVPELAPAIAAWLKGLK